MSMLADTVDAVIGVDTHTDTHTACMLDHLGRQISAITIPADPGGCRVLLAWAQRNTPGPRLAWAVEGTRSHGLGLARMLQAEGHAVVEANRPARASKRPGGKSDPADALRAARDALAAEQHARPRADGAREALRILLAARAQASTARTAAVNSLKALLLGAPPACENPCATTAPPSRSANAAPCGSPPDSRSPKPPCARSCAAWPATSPTRTESCAPTRSSLKNSSARSTRPCSISPESAR